MNKQGKRTNKLCTTRIGEKSTSSHGQSMEIIAYRNCDDIDIRFENGGITEHKRYDKFKKGLIRNPQLHLGETFKTHDGVKATIVRYQNIHDIDVKFETGELLQGVNYNSFVSWITRQSKYATIDRYTFKKLEEKLDGEITTNIDTDQQTVYITATLNPNRPRTLNIPILPSSLRTDLPINIQLKIVPQKQFIKHKRRKLKGRRNYANTRVGETTIAHNGQLMEIVKYNNSLDIDVKFEDGTIVTHKSYASFSKGSIRNPNLIPPMQRK